MLNVNEIRQWETIVSPTKECDIEVLSSFIQPMEDNQYAIINFPMNSKKEMMFVLCEYNKNMTPRCGLFTYVLTKEELENNFRIVGKYKIESYFE